LILQRRKLLSSSGIRAAAWTIVAALLFFGDAAAAVWGCHGTKPGHPTADERAAFIREVSELALRAEKTHGVPASALAAIAIAESGYGWTRVALDANNLFAWKFVPGSAQALKAYVPACERRRGMKERFAAFESKAHAFDFVALKLATLEAYREHTEAYRAARKTGEAGEAAVKAWLAGVASRYSQKPSEFTRKITRIMNDPAQPADVVSSEANLYRLSVGTQLP
jgi:flagellum-specific peptidoglycan hydrolase FlgJ